MPKPYSKESMPSGTFKDISHSDRPRTRSVKTKNKRHRQTERGGGSLHKENYSINRPPSSNVAYFNAILDQVDQIYTDHGNVILLGDLNYNYVSNQSLMTSPLYQLETMYGMTQLVCEPTRVTVNTATLLDVTFSTNYQSHTVTGVYRISLSNHYMV